jgi:hypothetical protein
MAREKFIYIISVGAEKSEMRAGVSNLTGLRFEPFLLPVEPVCRAGLPVLAGMAIVGRSVAARGFGPHLHSSVSRRPPEVMRARSRRRATPVIAVGFPGHVIMPGWTNSRTSPTPANALSGSGHIGAQNGGRRRCAAPSSRQRSTTLYPSGDGFTNSPRRWISPARASAASPALKPGIDAPRGLTLAQSRPDTGLLGRHALAITTRICVR